MIMIKMNMIMRLKTLTGIPGIMAAIARDILILTTFGSIIDQLLV